MTESRNNVIFRAALIACSMCLVLTVHLFDQMTMLSQEEVNTDSSSSNVATLIVGETNTSDKEVEEEIVETLYDEQSVQRLAKKLARAFPRSSKEAWCLPGILPVFEELAMVGENGELLEWAGEETDDEENHDWEDGPQGRRLATTVLSMKGERSLQNGKRKLEELASLGADKGTRRAQNKNNVKGNERNHFSKMNMNKENHNSYPNYKNQHKATQHRDWGNNKNNNANVGHDRAKQNAKYGYMQRPVGKKNGATMNGAAMNGAQQLSNDHKRSGGGGIRASHELNPVNFTKGVLLTKVHKSASTTMAGITIQILHRNKCGEGNFYHQKGQYYGNRDKSQSFMVAPIRDPASRAISYINYRAVSLNGMEPSDENALRILHNVPYSAGRGGYSLSYLSMSPLPFRTTWGHSNPTQVLNPSQVELNVKNVIQDYDFLVVVERIDESLVALALVMGIDVADVVTIGNAKVAGSGFDYFVTQRCVPLKKAVHSQGQIAQFLNSDQWRAMNYGDYLLHAAANHSLDMTIASLGVEYEKAFSRYMQLKTLAEERCASFVRMPCDTHGNIQLENDCFLRDYGCGYRCMYNLARNFTEGHKDDGE